MKLFNHLLFIYGLLFISLGCGNADSGTSTNKSTADTDQVVEKEVKLSKTDGSEVSFSIPESGIVVLEWFNPGCPFVQKIYKDGFMQELHGKYRDKGVSWYVINSTNTSHRDYLGTDERPKLVKDWNLNGELFFYDDNSKLAGKLDAKTTPHFFIYKDGTLVYNGAVDDAPSTDTNPEEAENYVTTTLDDLLAGNEVSFTRNRPYGCSIKYPG